MSPIRKKLIKIFLPIWLPIASAFIIGIFVWMAVGKEEQVLFILLYCVFTLSFALLPLCFLPWLNRKETQYILSTQYAYLMQDSWADAEEFETEDVETGIVYTVQKDGLKIVFPIPDGHENVFDEAPENVEFLPWDRARFALATSNVRTQVKMALAVLDVSTVQMEEDGATSYVTPFFVPLDERLVRAIKGLELEEKTDDGWAYLFYNTQDAIGQIQAHGYIKVLRDKQTGKRLSEEDWEKRKN